MLIYVHLIHGDFSTWRSLCKGVNVVMDMQVVRFDSTCQSEWKNISLNHNPYFNWYWQWKGLHIIVLVFSNFCHFNIIRGKIYHRNKCMWEYVVLSKYYNLYLRVHACSKQYLFSKLAPPPQSSTLPYVIDTKKCTWISML